MRLEHRGSEKSISERRGGVRRPAADLAEIIRDNSALKTTCMVRNISRTGALIEIGALEVPDLFILANHVRRVRMVCRIAWRRGKLIGVSFVTQPRRLAAV